MTREDREEPYVDLHSHLVPGVDDGATSVADTLDGVGRMAEKGIRVIVTTPHLDGSLTRMPEALESRLVEVDEAFLLARRAILDRYSGISFLRGHEVKLDLPDPDLSDPRIRLGDSDYVLVEWPRLQIPLETPSVLRELRAGGSRIVIAHPERYRVYDRSLNLISSWRKEEALLQVNFGSIVNRYGPGPRSLALKMLELGCVDCLASDFHGRPHLRIYLDAAREVFERIGADEQWDLLTRVNPMRITRGSDPLPVPPIEAGLGLVGRIRSFFRD